MIDYDTLVKAHALCDKSKFYLEYGVEGDKVSDIEIWAVSDSGDAFIYVCDIDELIDELEVLIKPKAKYKAGDKVWLLDNFNQPTEAVIGIHSNNDVWLVFDNRAQRLRLDSDDLYESREALIQSQLWHWTERMAELMHGLPGASCCSVHAGGNEECPRPDDKCEHEGEMLRLMSDSYVIKCKKCGEVYK